MLDGDVRCREHFGEVFGHVGMLGSAFEVAKHLSGKLAGGVDAAALGLIGTSEVIYRQST